MRTYRTSGYLTICGLGLLFGSSIAGAQVINETRKLTADDGSLLDYLGGSVSLENGVLYVGAWGNNDQGIDSGSVYTFDALTGEQLDNLTASDGQPRDHFGRAVAAFDPFLVVGADDDDDFGSDTGSGYVYNFFTGTQWDLLAPLAETSGGSFGSCVAIDLGFVGISNHLDSQQGNNAGVVYLYNILSFQPIGTLFSPEPSDDAWFGHSIALDDELLVVGAPNTGTGRAFVYNARNRDFICELDPGDLEPGDRFGFRVAIRDGLIAITSPSDDDRGQDSGSVYLFDALTGDLVHKITANDGAPGDQLGYSIALDPPLLAASAPFDDDLGQSSGSVYLFNTGTGTQFAKARQSDADPNDFFGTAIDLENNLLAVGHSLDDDIDFNTGAVYLFDLGCPADFTNDGVLDIFDAFAFLDAFNATDPNADFTGDGFFDIFDVFAFLDAFNTGCP